MNKITHPASGSILMLVVVLILVGAMVSASLAQISATGNRAATGDTYATEALFMAEAGVEATAVALVRGGCSTTTLPSPLNSPVINSRGQYQATTTYASGIWTITSNGYAPSAANRLGVRTVEVKANSCLDAPDPVVADPSRMTIGPAFRVRQEGETPGDLVATCTNNCAGSVVTEQAGFANRTYNFPIFDAFQPSSVSSGSTALSTYNPGDFNVINASGTVVFNAGTYRINRLVTANNTTLRFAPGEYYIKELDMSSNGGELETTPLVSGQKVNLRVKFFQLGTNLDLNWAGPGSPGDPKNLTVWVYDDASYPTNMTTTSGSQQIAAIIITEPGTVVNLGNGNTDVRGALLSQDTLVFGSNSTVIYDNLAKAAAISVMAPAGFVAGANFSGWRELF